MVFLYFKMQEEAAIREMESKELTERNDQLKRETVELRYVLACRNKVIVSPGSSRLRD